jgi:hypothetical protein
MENTIKSFLDDWRRWSPLERHMLAVAAALVTVAVTVGLSGRF